MNWYPHVTVAVVVEKSNKFLMVKERSESSIVINQPAGHLEEGEALIEAAIRECLEETAWHVLPEAYLGVSHYLAPNQVSYIRHSFTAKPIEHDSDRNLDSDILEALWLSKDEIQSDAFTLRSPLVLNDIKRFENGTRMKIEDIFCNI